MDSIMSLKVGLSIETLSSRLSTLMRKQEFIWSQIVPYHKGSSRTEKGELLARFQRAP